MTANTSRRIFENPELAAQITGISFQLIYRFKVILETISSGHEIDIVKYDEYAYDTAVICRAVWVAPNDSHYA